MLRALKHQLNDLSQENHAKFAAQIRKRVGAQNARTAVPALENFILVMPEMIAQIRAWSREERVPPELRQLHGHLLTYLYHPVDFLHDESYGLFGYLDDAYWVGAVYEATLNRLGPDAARFLPHQKDVSAQMGGWLAAVRQVIPKESARIDRMLRELSQGNLAGLQTLLERPNTASKKRAR